MAAAHGMWSVLELSAKLRCELGAAPQDSYFGPMRPRSTRALCAPGGWWNSGGMGSSNPSRENSGRKNVWLMVCACLKGFSYSATCEPHQNGGGFVVV